MPHNWWTRRASRDVIAEAGPLVIAHRGDRAHAPENTLVALERALAAGCDAFELDVHLTADSTVVVCHDATLDRTTDGTGAIGRTTFAELRERDAGARWSSHPDPNRANAPRPGEPTPFARQRIRVPSLDEVLDAFPATPMIIDAKSVKAGWALVDVLDRHEARERVIIGSFLFEALGPARQAGYATTASQSELASLLLHALLHRRASPVAFDTAAIPPRYRGFPLPVLGYARATARPVFVWTVNDPAAAVRLWAGGVSGIITDDPARLITARAALPQSTVNP